MRVIFLPSLNDLRKTDQPPLAFANDETHFQIFCGKASFASLYSILSDSKFLNKARFFFITQSFLFELFPDF